MDMLDIGEKRQVLDDTQIEIQAEILGHISDQRPDFLRLRFYVKTGNGSLARGRRQDGRQDAQGVDLPAPSGPISPNSVPAPPDIFHNPPPQIPRAPGGYIACTMRLY